MAWRGVRRRPEKAISPARQAAATGALLLVGLAAGVLIKLFDLYTTNLGNIFSQLSVWILIGTAVAVYSASPRRAAANVFAFCAEMLAAYYLTAHVTGSVYAPAFLWGWSAFSLLSPALAVLAWHAKGRGGAALLLKLGILACTGLAAVLLFDKLRLSDAVIMALEAAVLFSREK